MSRWIPMCALLLLCPTLSSAGEVSHRFSSSAQRVMVVELFTSEGCSSCPPADRWLSALRDDPDLWSRIVPLGFHVDYWDYLGWRDRFARARYGERQRQYADNGSARTVYTPGFFVNGREWRGFFGGRRPDAPRPLAGILEATLADGRVEVTFAPQRARRGLQATVALLGMGLITNVAAGENAGRELRHDFVVLGDSTSGMADSDETYTASIRMPKGADRAAAAAIVVWVSEAGDPAPLQAVGGFL